LRKELAIPVLVFGCFSELGSVAKNDEFLSGSRQGDSQAVFIEKDGGLSHKTQDDQIGFLSLALINRQYSVLGNIDW
jgi:hypothetical protein